MANARVSEIKGEVTLTMSQLDAKVLHSVVQFVGGSPGGPRGNFDNIGIALSDAGVPHDRRLIDKSQPYTGALFLSDEWPSDNTPQGQPDTAENAVGTVLALALLAALTDERADELDEDATSLGLLLGE